MVISVSAPFVWGKYYIDYIQGSSFATGLHSSFIHSKETNLDRTRMCYLVSNTSPEASCRFNESL